MGIATSLEMNTVRFAGREYRLLREEIANALSARRWRYESKEVATTRQFRPDVRPGDIEGERVITWDDWSRGVCGDEENLPGCLHMTTNAHGMQPGVLKPTGGFVRQTPTGVVADDTAAKVVVFNQEIFIIHGRLVSR